MVTRPKFLPYGDVLATLRRDRDDVAHATTHGATDETETADHQRPAGRFGHSGHRRHARRIGQILTVACLVEFIAGAARKQVVFEGRGLEQRTGVGQKRRAAEHVVEIEQVAQARCLERRVRVRFHRHDGVAVDTAGNAGDVIAAERVHRAPSAEHQRRGRRIAGGRIVDGPGQGRSGRRRKRSSREGNASQANIEHLHNVVLPSVAKYKVDLRRTQIDVVQRL